MFVQFSMIWTILSLHIIDAAPAPNKHYKFGNARAVEKGELPYQVSIRSKNLPPKFSHSCSGALVSTNMILTSAQCALRISARCQNYFVSDLFSHTEREIEDVIVHPSFNKDTLQGVALIQVKPSFIPNELIEPIKFAREKVKPDSKCFVSGWALPEGDTCRHCYLQAVSTSLIPKDRCVENYAGKVYRIIDDDTTICATQDDLSPDGYQGDIGAPLVCNNILTGIVSFGGLTNKDFWNVTSQGHPTVYNDVSHYSDWISKNIEIKREKVEVTTSISYGQSDSEPFKSGVEVTSSRSYVPSDSKPIESGVEVASSRSYVQSDSKLIESGVEVTSSRSYVPSDSKPIESGVEVTSSRSYVPSDSKPIESGVEVTSSSSYVPSDSKPIESGVEVTSSSSYVQSDSEAIKSGVEVTTSSSHVQSDSKLVESGLEVTSSSSYVQSDSEPIKSGVEVTTSSSHVPSDSKLVESGLEVTSSSSYVQSDSEPIKSGVDVITQYVQSDSGFDRSRVQESRGNAARCSSCGLQCSASVVLFIISLWVLI